MGSSYIYEGVTLKWTNIPSKERNTSGIGTDRIGYLAGLLQTFLIAKLDMHFPQ